jgi:tRNA 2-thiouridine synthesizing protein C
MTQTTRKEVLFIATRSPWSGSSAAAGADLLMTTAVFEQPVRVVFCGDGVWQLLADQNGDALKMKTLSRIFPAFELYDIRQVQVSDSALRERALTKSDLVIEASAASDDEIRALIASSKSVFVF